MWKFGLFLLVLGFSFATRAKAEGDQAFTKPLFFLVDDSQVRIQNPVVQYDLETDHGNSLMLGPLQFTNESLKVQIEEDILRVSWDTRFVAEGELSIVDTSGKVLWRVRANRNSSGEGLWKFQGWRGDQGPRWKSGDHLRFCLRADFPKGFSSICTQGYGVEVSEAKLRPEYLKGAVVPRVIVLNEEKMNLKGAVEVTTEKPIHFLATIKSGATYEFLSEVQRLDLKDIIESEKKDFVSIKGRGAIPLDKEAKVIPGIEYGAVTKALGFERTIAEPKPLWQVDLPIRDARLPVPGTAGGVFVYPLEIQSYPRSKDRLFIHRDSLSGTYRDKDKILVKVSKDIQVPNLKAVDVTNHSILRQWQFSAGNRFEENYPELLVQDGQQSHKAYLEVYRGAPGEISLRLSGINSSEGESSLVGEAHLSYWFNDLLDWQNYWFSKQRWGVSAKYFVALSKLAVEVGGGPTQQVDLTSLQLDMRYRFSPGLWERDETVGAILAYEGLMLGDAKVKKAGAGLFWARSMPRAIDGLLNKISFLNHPKFVDMEYIQFFNALDSGTSVGSDFVVNFHGKVMWAPELFGEAGFGIKSYSFTNANGSGASLDTFYLTLGMGYNF
ncbi:hypothetical protein [Bdellovibrio svalbardensis]|uniref:Uncharacterized protein n=1 Tax=Bdellovibrio svalbardensis TaxID=2972972 RepID=A0ABT6DHF5_9BACT|nr:hypothetical protein [Bdellovibrio svalbardensis]MDG0816296.1 hypothetical protein [Bdellovibrio svalbardensis]